MSPAFDSAGRSGERALMPEMLLEAAALKALPGIRHGFFTRHGGVSQGLYASLNAGLGSRDKPEDVRENRARMARALGTEDLVTAYQVHSPDVVVAEQPWTREKAPRADAVVTPTRATKRSSRRPGAPVTPCSTLGVMPRAGSPRRAWETSRISAIAPTRIPPRSSATAARCTAPSPTTAGT